MPSHRASAAPTWDALAARYGRQIRHELRAVWVAAELARVRAEDRVVDVATGSGLMLDVLRVRPDRPHRVLAVDRSAGMLARLGPLPPGWEAAQGDAVALPLADGSVDVATVSYLLQLLGDAERAAALAELHRVLVPGGRVVTVTVHVPRRGLPSCLAARGLDALAFLSPASLGGLRTHDPRPELAAAGFTVVRAAQRRHGYPSLVVLARRR